MAYSAILSILFCDGNFFPPFFRPQPLGYVGGVGCLGQSPKKVIGTASLKKVLDKWSHKHTDLRAKVFTLTKRTAG